jgi:hypothetical protein
MFLLRRVTLDDVGRITADQVAALARFVLQCSPDTLQQILSTLAQGPASPAPSRLRCSPAG